MNWLDRLQRRLAKQPPHIIDARVVNRRAAVAMVFSRQKPGELLLIRRAEHPKDPWSGHMGFPGGRCERGETDLEAAMRETHEEVGVDLKLQGQLLGRFDDVQAVGRGKAIPMAISSFFFVVEELPETQADPREVQEVVWVPLPFLMDDRDLPLMNYKFDGRDFEFPHYFYEGRQIWGLTFRMIRQFMSHLKAVYPAYEASSQET